MDVTRDPLVLFLPQFIYPADGSSGSDRWLAAPGNGDPTMMGKPDWSLPSGLCHCSVRQPRTDRQ